MPELPARPDGRLLRFAYSHLPFLQCQRSDPSTFDCMTTFALVHGAWCWEKVTSLLEQAGHDVVAADLPSDDGSAAFDAYAATMCSALKDCDDDVVV